MNRRTDEVGVYFEKPLCETGQVIDRQATVPLVHGRLQRKRNSGPDPLRSGFLHTELGGNGVGGPKANPAYLPRQPVWVLRHDLHSLMAVGLEDADGSGGP